MKPGVVVADEMFPEGAGPYTDLEEAGGSGGPADGSGCKRKVSPCRLLQ
ncbi:hypothetical protein MTO96_018302 [Rhipicephalus appendiculatus]